MRKPTIRFSLEPYQHKIVKAYAKEHFTNPSALASFALSNYIIRNSKKWKKALEEAGFDVNKKL